ncbi:MAG: hypothetical protein GXY32_10640 [Ruminococcaceae bacterium]|nr:hypothetical protein [Oscillospiraceae bacterium]
MKRAAILRKILAAGLMLCLLFTGLPMTALAQEDIGQGDILNLTGAEAPAEDGGAADGDVSAGALPEDTSVLPEAGAPDGETPEAAEPALPPVVEVRCDGADTAAGERWLAALPWLALDASDVSGLARVTVLENTVETELYPAQAALEDAGEAGAVPVPAFSAAGVAANVTDATLPEALAETFRYYQVGQAASIDGVYELEVTFAFLNGESESQQFVFLIDNTVPQAPTVTVQPAGDAVPGAQRVTLEAASGPSGHHFLVAVGEGDYTRLEGDTCLLEGPGSYRFAAGSGAGLVSEPTEYVLEAEADAIPDTPAGDSGTPPENEAAVPETAGPATPNDAGGQVEAPLPGTPAEPGAETQAEDLAPAATPAATGWVPEANGYRFYNADGTLQTGWLTYEAKRYYLNPTAGNLRATGMRQVAGVWYNFAATGEVLSGFHTLAEADGTAGSFYTGDDFVTRTGWVDYAGARYYAGADGLLLRGLVEIDGSWYNLDSTTCAVLPGWVTAPSGAKYYVKDDFRLNLGWLSADGKRYYMHPETGLLQTGWQQVEGSYFYLEKKTGAVRKGWQTAPDKKKYYVQKDYTAAKGWLKVDGETYYMHAETGALQKGWLTLDDKKYYLDSGGVRVTGTRKIGKSYYRFASNGAVKSGWFTAPNGKRYYTEKDTWTNAKGWVDVGSKRYYCDPETGAMVSGKKKIDGSWYVLDPKKNGALQYGWVTSATNKKARYYTDKNTRENARGWLTISKKLYYFDKKTGRVKTGKAKVDGIWYQFDSTTGAVKTKTIITTSGGSYYMNSKYEYTKGWLTHQKERYYGDLETGKLLIGTNQIDGIWYSMDKTGAVQTNTAMKTPDGLYFMTTKYTYGSGWQTDAKGKRYYADKETKQLVTGKNFISKTWYNMSTSTGAVKPGWVTVEDGKYYIKANGKPASGTLVIKGVTYNFDKYGKLQKEVLHGIDVSVYQGNIDWAAVAASGQVDFAIMRALTWSNGGYTLDTTFDTNVRRAKENGIMVGAYLYTYAFGEAEMAVEINYFVNHPVVKKLKADGYLFDLPIFIDFEDKLVLDNTASYNHRTEILRRGLVMLDNAGYTPGFYSNHNWAVNCYNAPALQAEGYPFWYAHYLDNTPGKAHTQLPWGGATPAIWQYTSNGVIPGITANTVDLNHCYASYYFKAIKK